MRGFKAHHSADATLSGIELYHMLRKGQHQQSPMKLFLNNFMGLQHKFLQNKSVCHLRTLLRQSQNLLVLLVG
jgi:hypothetical protein